MKCVLGVDVGSSSAKVGLFTMDGRLVSMSTRSYGTSQPKPGWKEQDPEAWWKAVADSVREIGCERDLTQVAGLGCAGYIGSNTFVDRHGAPLRPAMSFQDRRAVAETEELYSLIDREELSVELGIDLPPAATWPLPRLLWLLNNEPALLDHTHRVLQAKDFINFRLTGDFSTDASSNRGLLHLDTGQEAEGVLSRLGLPHGLLPAVYRPEEVVGRVSAAASAATGLPRGIPVVAGWNDLNASILGSGAATDGDAFDVTGSSEHVGVVTASAPKLAELMCGPFLPGRKLFYGMTLNGGGAFAWFCNTFGLEIERIAQAAEEAPPGSESLFFLPYLDGERAPIWDSRAAGAFIGLRSHHTQAHLARAVLEGVAYSLLQILELVEQEAGKISTPIVISGGAARIRLWNEIKRNVWNRPIAVPENIHTGTLGAAMLAAAGAGTYASCEEAASQMARVAERLPALARWTDVYRRAYIRFCDLYPRLREHFVSVHDDSARPKEPACLTRPQ